jgi:colanic acid biosynthesis glycosyl transferase WcaI
VRILILNEYYPPDTSATAKMAGLVAEALAKKHEVTVVAGRPSYDPDETFPWALLQRRMQNSVIVERVGSTAYPRHQMRRRVSNYLTYLALAVPRSLFARTDVIIAMTDPPIAGIAGAFVSTLSRRPFIYNIRDLYPDMAVGGDIVRPGFVARLWERMHRRALRQAARVIVLGDDMRDRILKKGVAANRVEVVRDGTHLPDVLADAANPIAQEIRCGFHTVAIHAGNLGFYGAWDTLLHAARLLQGTGFGLVFVGEGANRLRLQQSAEGLSNVRFLPFRPVEQIPYVMAAGDIHIVTVKRGLEGVVVPSKLFSILAAGRPVLAVAPMECDAARIVVEAGCGVAADPDDPAAVVAAIRAMSADPDTLTKMGQRAREIARSYVRVDELARYVEVVEKVAHNGSSPRP